MSPPERTLGPIGWKGLFGDDESDDDRTADDERQTADAGTGDDRGDPREGGTRPTRPGETDRPRSGGADARPDRGGEAADRSEFTAGPDRPEPTASPGRPDRSTDVDDRVREARSKTAEELSGDDGAASDTPTADPDTGYILTDTAGSAPAANGATDPGNPAADLETEQSTQPADDPGSSSGADDAGVRSGSATGGGTPTGDTSNLWVNPLDDEADASAPDTQDWEQGIVDASSAPATEPRVRTSRSDTHDGETAATDREVTSSGPESTTGEPATTAGEPEATREESEFTLGPIGIKGLPFGRNDTGEATVSETTEQPPRRRERSSSSTVTRREPAQPPEATHTGKGNGEEASAIERLTNRVPWSISLTAIGVGVGLLVFVDIVSLMVPLIAAIGAGIVGGFVAGYISGGTVRGGMHALAVGIIGGIAVGYLTALIGALLGLFLEPATLLGSVIGPIAPELGMFGAWGPLLVMVFVTAMVAVDATIAGVVGGTLRSVVDEAR